MREKLIDLLMQKGFGVEGATIAADHLIANGVTIPVRCVECKHYRHFKGCGNWCHRRLRSDIEFKVKPSDFCSYGERRT